MSLRYRNIQIIHDSRDEKESAEWNVPFMRIYQCEVYTVKHTAMAHN